MKASILLFSLATLLALWVLFAALVSVFFGINFLKFYAFLYGAGIALIFLFYPKLKKIIDRLFT